MKGEPSPMQRVIPISYTTTIAYSRVHGSVADSAQQTCGQESARAGRAETCRCLNLAPRVPTRSFWRLEIDKRDTATVHKSGSSSSRARSRDPRYDNHSVRTRLWLWMFQALEKSEPTSPCHRGDIDDGGSKKSWRTQMTVG